MNIEEVKKQALKELQEESDRVKINAYKEKLKKRRSLLDRIFPYKIIRKDELNV